MSDSKPKTPEREWRFFLDDMITCAEKVIAYTRKLDQAGFEADCKSYDATIRNLELIGEAATHIPQSVRDAATSIPWRQIIATRNRLIHGYLGIDNDTLWSIVQDDIPGLLSHLRELKKLAP
ncbi:MAG: nucleotidyltransferase [Rhodospirillales bacterium RIFCSPLOWO2_12_FULL_58_28]|nr:MAG: nucleotidyltransferase [Rhodospirillales bacterium RIFCSPLOWO2_02_FULL_58_16]OHC79126.1 MAG: nucleotidyltransferase [Rhodospirillales bacterium RIFCSPLOWO2_12_FULL_58_28]